MKANTHSKNDDLCDNTNIIVDRLSKVVLNDKDTTKDESATSVPKSKQCLAVNIDNEKFSKEVLNGKCASHIENIQQCHNVNTIADRLSEVALIDEETARSGENFTLLEKEQQCLDTCTNDELCVCEECKWKKRFDIICSDN